MQNHLVFDFGFVFIYIFAFGMSQFFVDRYISGHYKPMMFYIGCLVVGVLIVKGYILPISPDASNQPVE